MTFLLTYLFLPKKIETHEVEKVVNRNIIVHKIRTVLKDGTITTITDSHDLSHEIQRESTKKTVGLNQKRLLVFGGIDPLHRDDWIVGMSYNLLGPVDIGASYREGVLITAGLRF